VEIIAIPTNGKGGLKEDLSPRFGRCSSFTFVTIENNEINSVKTVPNHAGEAMGGAGVQASQIVGMNNANVVIVGKLGPNAAQALSALNLKIIAAPSEILSVKKVIDLYIGGQLQELSGSNVGSHFGANSGQGMGNRNVR